LYEKQSSYKFSKKRILKSFSIWCCSICSSKISLAQSNPDVIVIGHGADRSGERVVESLIKKPEVSKSEK